MIHVVFVNVRRFVVTRRFQDEEDRVIHAYTPGVIGSYFTRAPTSALLSSSRFPTNRYLRRHHWCTFQLVRGQKPTLCSRPKLSLYRPNTIAPRILDLFLEMVPT